nr:CHAT domain-containing protein [Lysobacter sp. CAU 1642]
MLASETCLTHHAGMLIRLAVMLLIALACRAAAAACDAGDQVVVSADRIEITRPAPGQALVGWIEMTGAEWEVLADGAPLPVWPERSGRLPLHVPASGESRMLTLPLRHAAGPDSRLPRVELECLDALDPAAQRQALLVDLAGAHARLSKSAAPLKAMRWVGRMAGALWRSAGDGKAVDWIEHQALLLAITGSQRGIAAAWAERLQSRAESRGDEKLSAHAELIAGQMLLMLAPEPARRHLGAAEERFRSLGDDYYAAVARQELCLHLRLSGDPERAVDCYARVIATHRRLGESDSALRTQLNRATALSSLGRYDEAFAQLNEAERTAVGTVDPSLRAALLRQRAQFQTWRGQFGAALKLLRQLRRHYDQVMDPVWSAHTDFLIGTNFLLAGEPIRALEYYDQAEQRIAGTPHVHLRIKIRLAKSVTHTALDRSADAIEFAREALEDVDQANDLLTEQSAWMRLSEALLAAGRDMQAAEALERLPGDLTPRLKLQKALITAELGRADEARPSWQEELDVALAADQLLLAMRIGERLVHELAEMGDDEAALAQATRLFARVIPVVRSLRSPALRDALSGQLHGIVVELLAFQPEGPVSAGRAETIRALLWKLADAHSATGGVEDSELLLKLEKQLGLELLPGGNGPEVASGSLHLALIDAESQAETGGPQRLPGTERLVLGKNQRFAAPLIGRRAGGWLVFDGAAWSWWPMDVQGLRGARNGLVDALSDGHADGDQVAEYSRHLREALGLHRWVDESVERLWLLMHRELAVLPLDIVLPGAAHTAVGWVIFPGNTDRPTPSRVWALGVDASGGSPLPELSAVSREVSEVHAIWPADAHGRSEARASRGRLFEALADQDALVHLAAHGRASRTHYEGSGLWMADAEGRPDFVSAYRLRTSPVKAALVVLSACETGQGAGRQGIGIGGVASSLAEAGAGSVVGARWAVGDRAALAFSLAFHRALKQHPADPERALAVATAEIRRIPTLRNPTHWSGWFVLSRGVPGPGESVESRAEKPTNGRPLG